MATVTYSVKDTQIRVNVGAKDTSASICWVGITKTVDDCWTSSEEGSFCESVYIGENTDCINNKYYSGTFLWNGITIYYYITQAHADCPDCGRERTSCEIIDYYVDPYYVDADTRSVKVYYNYWYIKEDNCGLSRERKKNSVTVGIDPSTVRCDDTNRELNVPFNDACGVSHTAKCYVQKPDMCCDDPSKRTCYVINDIVYSPSIVPSSGADVSYYFDYKKIETENCIETITFGRYEGVWKIDKCDSDPSKAPQRCCRNHIEKKKLSDLVSVWDDKVLCNGGVVGNTELSIIQTKDPTYTNCSNVCEQDTGYCVSYTSITTFYKDENDEWKPWGQWANNEDKWRWLDPNYELPYFGGNMRVTWAYSAYTVYEDCTTGMTSGSEWEDILDILPYQGDCFDELKNQCGIISIKSEEANRCDGGTTKFEFALNENVELDYVIYPIEYVFKKAPCELTDKDKFPNAIGILCDTGETPSTGDCNKFTIKYKQKKTICDEDCESCINPHDEGIFVCSKCGYKIGAYEDESHKLKPYADKCPICETEFRTRETETDYQVLSDSMTYYLPSALTDSKFTDSDCYDTTCTLKLIDKPFWVTAVTVNEGSITYEVEDNTGSDREGGVTFQLNGRDCYDTVLLCQYGTREDVDPHGEDPDVPCDCENAFFDAYPLNGKITGKATQHVIIGSYSYDDCITDVKPSGTAPNWLSNISCNDGYIYADVADGSTTEERASSVTVTYSVDEDECSSKTIAVKQKKKGEGGDCDIDLIVGGDTCPGGEVTITVNF